MANEDLNNRDLRPLALGVIAGCIAFLQLSLFIFNGFQLNYPYLVIPPAAIVLYQFTPIARVLMDSLTRKVSNIENDNMNRIQEILSKTGFADEFILTNYPHPEYINYTLLP